VYVNSTWITTVIILRAVEKSLQLQTLISSTKGFKRLESFPSRQPQKRNLQALNVIYDFTSRLSPVSCRLLHPSIHLLTKTFWSWKVNVEGSEKFCWVFLEKLSKKALGKLVNFTCYIQCTTVDGLITDISWNSRYSLPLPSPSLPLHKQFPCGPWHLPLTFIPLIKNS
jgi:hypothetical protein